MKDIQVIIWPLEVKGERNIWIQASAMCADWLLCMSEHTFSSLYGGHVPASILMVCSRNNDVSER